AHVAIGRKIAAHGRHATSMPGLSVANSGFRRITSKRSTVGIGKARIKFADTDLATHDHDRRRLFGRLAIGGMATEVFALVGQTAAQKHQSARLCKALAEP